MKLAFILYKYFPHGGLQRDFMRIAECCVRKGHQIKVHTMSWQGEIPDWIDLSLYTISNHIFAHRRNKLFHQKMTCRLRAENVDLKIGFNKMPDLDVYYAADSCYEEKVCNTRGALYRYTARYKHFSAFEHAVFNSRVGTDILLIAHKEKHVFQKHYGTCDKKFYYLPPGIAKDRCYPENAELLRKNFRTSFQLKEHDFLLLMVGSGFKTKGVDRSIQALAALPEAIKDRVKLFIVGQDRPDAFLRLAKKLKINHNIRFFQGRDDVLNFYLGADLLIHPAYNENTGTVLLEALSAGLPVVCTKVCGYAPFIEESEAGAVLDDPFSLEQMTRTLTTIISENRYNLWHAKAIDFSRKKDLFSMPEKAATLIEEIGQKHSG